MIGNAVSIEVSRDLFCRMTLLDVLPKNPLNHLNFFRWAKLKDDPVGFQVLLLTAQQIPLRKPILVDQLATKSVGQWTTNSAAITRLRFLTMLERRLPSLSNCSAQYSTMIPACRHRNS